MTASSTKADVNLFCSGLHANDRRFDLNGDGRVGDDDLELLVHDSLGTSFGDADLNGVFDSTDFVQIFTAGEYEDGIARQLDLVRRRLGL